MEIRPVVVLTILGMTVITYVTKVSGYWLLGHIDVSDRVEAGFNALPAAILLSIVVPEVVTGELPEWGATIVVVFVAWKTENILVAMVTGLGAVLMLRALFP